MKKKIAFLMASIMAVSTVTMSKVNSFASSENKLSNGNITVSEKTLFYEPGADVTVNALMDQSDVKYLAEANYLNINLEDAIKADAEFSIELENAKFAFDAGEKYLKDKSPLKDASAYDSKTGVYTRNANADVKPVAELGYTLTVNDENNATVKLTKVASENTVTEGTEATVTDSASETVTEGIIKIPLVVRMDETLTSGTAKVIVRAGNSGLSSNSLVFATIYKGSTTTSVPSSDVQTGKNKIGIPRIVIKENVAGSMRVSDGNGFYLELPSGYYFSKKPATEDFTFVNVSVADKDADLVTELTSGGRILNVKFNKFSPSSNGLIGQIIIKNLEILANSSNELNGSEDIKITIDNLGSSEMVTSQEFLAGTRVDYGLTFKTDGTVPTVLSGYYDSANLINDKTKSVKVTVSEETAGSLINGGNLIFTLSDSVKINAVKIEDRENITQANKTYALEDNTDANVEVKANKVTLRNIRSTTSTTSSDKSKFSISFYLSVEPGFEGDVSVSVSGDAIRNNTSMDPVVIAKAVNPLAVTVATNYIKPAQTIELSDIVLTEQLNSKGYSALEESKTVSIGFANNNHYLSFVGTPTIKTENGLTVKDVKTSNTSSGSILTFTIDDASSKNKVSKLTISGLKVAASASTPQGTYGLVMGGNAVAGNSTAIVSGTDKATFATDGMLIAKLQYGGKVAMKITIGDKVAVINGQEVEMKMAPFIDAATGTTYMQASDIVKATGKTCTFFDNRIQNVEGIDKTLFVTFGDRTFEKGKSIVKIASQTLPETMTNEQGIAVNMIIKDDYTCLPLRYFVEKVLGQTIDWNGTDSTVTVN